MRLLLSSKSHLLPTLGVWVVEAEAQVEVGLDSGLTGGTSARVERWKDGITVKTSHDPQLTLVEFEFSEDEGEEEDDEGEQEVVNGAVELSTDSSEGEED